MRIGDEGSHADGLGESGVVGRMSGPGLAEIGGAGDSAAIGVRFVLSVAVVAHVEEEGAVGELGDGALGGVVAGWFGDGPGFAVVFARDNVGERDTVFIAALRGHHEDAVFQSNAISGSGSEEVPGGVLEFRGPVFRSGPGGSVVGGADDHELGGLVDVESGFGALSTPLVGVRFSVGPAGSDEDLTGVVIDEDAGVGAAVFFLRFSAVFAHVHDRGGRGPGLASVFGNAEADVYMLLEVFARVVAHVGDGKEVAVFCTGDAGDAKGVTIVITAFVDEGGESLRILGKAWGGL